VRCCALVLYQKGSHTQLRNPGKAHLRVTIPRHDSFDLPKSVLRSILRQAEITVEEFLDLL
jgi:predicted RNA binding protein YcfA (HicA-like mRNA interferase family)